MVMCSRLDLFQTGMINTPCCSAFCKALNCADPSAPNRSPIPKEYVSSFIVKSVSLIRDTKIGVLSVRFRALSASLHSITKHCCTEEDGRDADCVSSQRSCVIATASISENSWFSPPMAQTKE